MLLGWFSNSKFSFLGSIRAISQSISFEISLGILIFSILLRVIRFRWYTFTINNIYYTRFYFISYSLIIKCLLAELNRIPFDFKEGESELVSGFNIEYLGVRFVFIFLAEYGRLLFYSVWFFYLNNFIRVFIVIFFYIISSYITSSISIW